MPSNSETLGRPLFLRALQWLPAVVAALVVGTEAAQGADDHQAMAVASDEGATHEVATVDGVMIISGV